MKTILEFLKALFRAYLEFIRQLMMVRPIGRQIQSTLLMMTVGGLVALLFVWTGVAAAVLVMLVARSW